ncbi:MAG: hypothetical protein DRP59_06115 [Spirochaetes bacterium]|nr:MAG: hypothetical protein DRP59_06115 [Spirochaetota bacterium]
MRWYNLNGKLVVLPEEMKIPKLFERVEDVTVGEIKTEDLTDDDKEYLNNAMNGLVYGYERAKEEGK